MINRPAIRRERRAEDVLTSVATGGPRIEDKRWEPQQRRWRLLPALERRGLPYPFPWQDLWEWYGYWSRDLPGYASRRAKIRDLVGPVVRVA